MTAEFEKRIGTFEPRQRDDLQDGVSGWIGRRLIWQAAWVIEDEPYRGQWAWRPLVVETPPFAWTPECDIHFDSGEG